MAADHEPATRRLMNALGEESRIPLFNIEEGDLYVLVGLPIAGLFVGSLTGIDSLVIPLVALGLFFGIVAVYAAPEHLSASTWISDLYRYYVTRPQITYNVPLEAEGTGEATTRNEGGFINYTPFTPDERTQDFTNVERAWPGAGAIERTDGTMVAILELNPGNMDFAMSGDWAQLQSIGERFANNELDFSLRFHATTRSFPVERLVERIDERLEDDDITENPTVRNLLAEYRDKRPQEMAGTQQLQYYLSVEVTPFEVYQRFHDEHSPAERLTRIPVAGFLFNPFVTRREDLTEAALRSKLFEKLTARVRVVETELVGKAPGWSARRLSTVELFVLAMDFWNGEEHDSAGTVVRDQPVISHESRENAHE